MKHANRKLSGALAWSPQVAMNRREIDEFLSGRWVARVATIGVDGYPHVYPFWYYWDGECLYFTATQTRGSYRDLKANPRCSVVIDMDDRPLMGMRLGQEPQHQQVQPQAYEGQKRIPQRRA